MCFSLSFSCSHNIILKILGADPSVGLRYVSLYDFWTEGCVLSDTAHFWMKKLKAVTKEKNNVQTKKKQTFRDKKKTNTSTTKMPMLKDKHKCSGGITFVALSRLKTFEGLFLKPMTWTRPWANQQKGNDKTKDFGTRTFVTFARTNVIIQFFFNSTKLKKPTLLISVSMYRKLIFCYCIVLMWKCNSIQV